MNAPVQTPELPTIAAPTTAEAPLEDNPAVEGVDWAGVSSDDDEDGGYVEPQPQPEVKEEVAAPAAPTAPIVTETPAVEVPKPAEPAAPVVTPPVEQKPAGEAPVVDRAAEEARIQAQLEEAYAMTEEEALAFQTEPELVLPKIAAKLHRQIALDVISGIQTILPAMLRNINVNTEAETKARGLFYEKNPDLNNPQFEEAIIQCGKLFRSVNKDAPPEQAVVLIGNMARQALGLPPLQVNPAPGGDMPPVAVPQPPQKIVPFSPARGGSGATVAAKPLSPWEEFADDDD